MRPLRKIAMILILSLLIAPVFLLKGCGNTTPDGATVTISPSGPTITGISADSPTPFLVTVRDKDGNPLNGVKVDISGAFAYPRLGAPTARYQFFKGLCGSVDTCTQPVSSLPLEDTTDTDGTYKFTVMVPVFVNTPGPAAVTQVGTVGITNYTYMVVALDENGFAAPSNADASIHTGAATLSATDYNIISWRTVAGVTGYVILGRQAGALNLIAMAAGGTTFNDQNQVTLAAPPAAPAVAFVGTPATTSYTYALAAVDTNGIATPSGATTTFATGSATLSTSDYFKVTLPGPTLNVAWWAIYGRQEGGPLTLLAVVPVANTVFIDNGSAGGGAVNSFTDTIYVFSGTASAASTITLK